MSRRHAFREADVARALKATQRVGLAIARIEIDQAGKIVIVTERPADATTGEQVGPSAALAALRKQNAERRAERAASRQALAR